MGDDQDAAQNEIIIQGLPASPGVAVGKAFVYKKEKPQIFSQTIDEESVPGQLALFKRVQEDLKTEWQHLRQQEQDQTSKAVLDAQIAIIIDPQLTSEIRALIEEKHYGVQHAIQQAFKNYIDKFSATGNSVLHNRKMDLTDIRDRLVKAVTQSSAPLPPSDGDIVVSAEISPREVIQFSHRHIKGLVMEQGGNTSHAVIIARSVGIPAVVGAKGVIEKMQPATELCIDGKQGLVSINPTAHTRERAKQLRGSAMLTHQEQQRIVERPSQTTDGKSFTLRANVEFAEELENVQKYDARGVGLLRTESQYLDQQQMGSTQKQVGFYRQVLTQTGDDPVTIRLFDVGGDKFQQNNHAESNPFLGWRGIRMLLDEREMLRDQLKAILTVAGEHPGRVRLLVPMVSTLDEIAALKVEIARCLQEVIDDGNPVDNMMMLGIMVEIPSVALQTKHFADEVDFLSIGTNDLTQYLLAVDRGNPLISSLYDQRHPAVWKVIDHVASVAREHHVEVDVCGELASYPVAAACLVGMGVTTLSMTPVNIPMVKNMLTKKSHKQMEKLAEQVLLCEQSADVKSLFKNWKTK